MENFDQLLVAATQELGSEYFYLAIHNAPAIYKERVYCYEIYYQLRRRWPKETLYRLNGEVDKAGHPDFSKMRMIPDFLVHQPGTTNNFLVMEVKRCDSYDLNDFRKLRWFLKYGYKRAIWLVYGQDAENVAKEQMKALKKGDLIEVWVHKESTQPAYRLT
ncbi:MAG: hypothetical protein QG574_5248 [Cyanobacteriota bacterium erpe_2018_sw_21hr_WHONDRS-SW48-000092_B_bin.40]|jgi:hypothetical protein|nr:hypothetical protein [Cyanobacteriota bacterium erpe_2018_sw_21hr_WHONDRS-SW48-000092_B_bin.40]